MDQDTEGPDPAAPAGDGQPMAAGQPTLAGLQVPQPPRSQSRSRQSRSPQVTSVDAPSNPVAEVVVDSHLAHLDRPFEYAVPPDLDQAAQVGVRVRVRFAGRVIDGFLLARKPEAEHPGRLAPLLKVVSPEVVLTPQLAQLCRQVADHYAGTLADVLRLAVPPRHARAERALPAAADTGVPPEPRPEVELTPEVLECWSPYPAGEAYLRRLAAGQSPAAAWTAAPDAGSPDGWPAALAAAVTAVHTSGRGSIVVLPDGRDVERVATALDTYLGPDAYVRLTADLGPAQRYSAWLRASRGQVTVVIGTRSAAFVPMARLGLLAWWDDGDDSLQEPRAPYPHVREVLRIRRDLTGAAVLVGGYARTAAVQHWVQHDGLPEIRPAHQAVAAGAPRVIVAGEGHQGARDAAATTARLPSVAWRAVKDGLLDGPVLVQVPRRGYLLALSCEHCRTPVRCASCAGPVQVAQQFDSAPTCGWCGRADRQAPCRECGSTRRRSRVVGEQRTAEEVGRAFPGARVIVSRAGQVVDRVGDQPTVVVATPGAEPIAAAGYAAVLLLDGWALLDRGGLDAGLEALRRWLAAAALATPGSPVVLAGVPPHAGLRPVEALVRWAPVWLASRELADRVELGLPPARRTATLTGDASAVSAAAERLAHPTGPGLELLGPLPVSTAAAGPDQVRLVVRATTDAEVSLPQALHDLRASRSLHKEDGELTVRLDPQELDF